MLPPTKPATPTTADQSSDLAVILRNGAREQGQSITLNDGDDLIHEGEVSDRIYVLEAGEITVSIKNQSGDSTTVATLKPGAVIGEMTLFGETRRSATCSAKGNNVQLISLENETALLLIDSNIKARNALVKELTKRSRSMLQYINEFSYLTRLISSGDLARVQSQINIEKPTDDATVKAARKEFATMLARIKEREAELQDKIQLLTIEIDHARAAKEVDSIENDPIFQQLKNKSGSLRDRLRGA
ncbi:MAG: cyclic nucleotide-binding domain-containing protein [Cyanobacteria bacterium]|nr:cyclic nucleotide-binding domain-containing protein [Cyanobacteriota bacterium]